MVVNSLYLALSFSHDAWHAVVHMSFNAVIVAIKSVHGNMVADLLAAFSNLDVV